MTKLARKARTGSVKRKPVVDTDNLSENESLWGDGRNAPPTSSFSLPPKRAETRQAKPAKAVDRDFEEFCGYAKLLTAGLDAQVNKR